MKIKLNHVKKACKRDPIGPRKMMQGKTRGAKRHQKTQRLGITKPPWPVGTMT